ncbi:MAG: SDR family oxidoreductase [Acidimicrobiales bacterium]
MNNVGGSMPQAFSTHRNALRPGHAVERDHRHSTSHSSPCPTCSNAPGQRRQHRVERRAQRQPRFAAYGTAKAALIHLTKELAQDLAPKIRVNAVCPGAIATSALDIVLQTPELEQAMNEGTPLGRLGQADEIAAAALYFASPAGAYTTGQFLGVDGGIQTSNLEMGIPDL